MNKKVLENAVNNSWHYLNGYTHGMAPVASRPPKDYNGPTDPGLCTFDFPWWVGSAVTQAYGTEQRRGSGCGMWIENLICDPFVPVKGASISRGKGVNKENITERKLIHPATRFLFWKKPAQYQFSQLEVVHPLYLDSNNSLTTKEVPQRRLNALLMSAFDYRLRGGAFIAYALVTTEVMADQLETELRQTPHDMVALFNHAFPQYQGFRFNHRHKTSRELQDKDFSYISTKADIEEVLRKKYPSRDERVIKRLE